MFSCLFKKKDKNKEIIEKTDSLLERRRKRKFSVVFWPHYLYVIPEEPDKELMAVEESDKEIQHNVCNGYN